MRKTMPGLLCCCALKLTPSECVAVHQHISAQKPGRQEKGLIHKNGLKNAGQISESLCQLEPERLASPK